MIHVDVLKSRHCVIETVERREKVTLLLASLILHYLNLNVLLNRMTTESLLPGFRRQQSWSVVGVVTGL